MPVGTKYKNVLLLSFPTLLHSKSIYHRATARRHHHVFWVELAALHWSSMIRIEETQL